jgi:hypothetical protein
MPERKIVPLDDRIEREVETIRDGVTGMTGVLAEICKMDGINTDLYNIMHVYVRRMLKASASIGSMLLRDQYYGDLDEEEGDG